MVSETPAKFRTQVREICAEYNDVSRVEISEIVQKISKQLPEAVEKEKNRLLNDSIANIVRSLFHRDHASQMILPMSLAGVDPPSRIAVRPKGIKSGPAIWVLADELTYDELNRKVANSEPRSNTPSEWAKLKALRDVLKPLMEKDHPNEPIGPVLAELARKEVDVRRSSGAA